MKLKKLLMIVSFISIVLITLFSLNSCGKTMSIDKARTLAIKALGITNDYINMKISFHHYIIDGY